MASVVRFRTGDGEFAVAVEQTLEVRTTRGLMALPEAAPEVVGLLPHSGQPLTVVAALGAGGDQVLVLQPTSRPDSPAFGLLVQEVTGVASVDDEQVGPPPSGQSGGLVCGVIRDRNTLILLIDADAVGRALAP